MGWFPTAVFQCVIKMTVKATVSFVSIALIPCVCSTCQRCCLIDSFPSAGPVKRTDICVFSILLNKPLTNAYTFQLMFLDGSGKGINTFFPAVFNSFRPSVRIPRVGTTLSPTALLTVIKSLFSLKLTVRAYYVFPSHHIFACFGTHCLSAFVRGISCGEIYFTGPHLEFFVCGGKLRRGLPYTEKNNPPNSPAAHPIPRYVRHCNGAKRPVLTDSLVSH